MAYRALGVDMESRLKTTITSGTARRAPTGFTLIELVVIMVILGILAAVAVPVFFDLGTYKERAAYDEVASALRYAQKLAVASGCNIQVKIENNEYQLGRAVPCDENNTSDFVELESGFPVSKGPDEKVTLTATATNLYFDNMGRSSVPVEIKVGVAEKPIKVHAETGYVYAP